MPADKHKKLAKLGAETLATSLLNLANYSDDADRIVDRLIASPRENAKSFKQRLSGLKRRRQFITWRESGAFARELVSLLKSLEASGPNPKEGVEAVVSFYKADSHIFEMCDDSNGSIGDVFRFEAADLFVSFASLCEDKEWLVDFVVGLNQNDDYGVRDVLFERMSEYLPESNMLATVDKLWELAETEKDIYGARRWLFAIEDLAKQLKDPLLLERALRAASEGELSTAAIIEIAKLHLECGDFSAAQSWSERVPLENSYMANERDQLMIAIYKAENNSEKLEEAAWRVFRSHRSPDTLETLLDAVGQQKRETIAGEEAKAILKRAEFVSSDAEFLLAMDRIDDAERYIVGRMDKLDGDFYLSLLPLAEAMLKHDCLIAASAIYRALLDSILARAKSKTYHHGVNYLKKLDSMADTIQDWQDVKPHAEYFANLCEKHKRKSSFWSQYNG